MRIIEDNTELRPLWAKIFNFDWKFGSFLILIICIPRFLLVLDANASGNYSLIGAIMIVSAVAPFIFLTKNGRRKIGIAGTRKYKWILKAFIFGVSASLLLYYLGHILYGISYENWFVYIAKSYKIPEEISGAQKRILFAIMAVAGMTFSPVGEEFFFRGIVHSSFAKSLGEKRALLIDGLAFSFTHISHFGLVFLNNHFKLYLVPTILWVLSMFLLSLLFYYCKKKTDSLLGAVICHGAFNLGMIYSIFYLL